MASDTIYWHHTDNISACERIVAVLLCFFFVFSISVLHFTSFLSLKNIFFHIFPLRSSDFLNLFCLLPFPNPHLHFLLSLVLSPFPFLFFQRKSCCHVALAAEFPKSGSAQTEPPSSLLRVAERLSEVEWLQRSIMASHQFYTHKWSISAGHKKLHIGDTHPSSSGVLAVLLQHTSPIVLTTFSM